MNGRQVGPLAAVAVVAVLVVALAAGGAIFSSSQSAPQPTGQRSASYPSPAPGACSIAAAGDIAEQGGDQAQTAAVVEALAPTAVLTLGDNAYPDGSAADFRDYYEPSWGTFKQITRPAPGNHDYHTGGAAGYFGYFKVPPYYSYDLCGWHLYSLNREISGAERDAELAWLRRDLASHQGVPMLAVWHEPRWSSGTTHGSSTSSADLWEAVTAGGVRVVLNGHEHSYERFAELDAAGRPSPGGTREFVVGEGGSESLYRFGDPLPGSERQVSGAHGVLSLVLHPDGYDWRLVQVDGSIADQGSQQIPAARSPSTSPLPGQPSVPAAAPAPPGSTPSVPGSAASVPAPSPSLSVPAPSWPAQAPSRPTPAPSWSVATPTPGPTAAAGTATAVPRTL